MPTSDYTPTVAEVAALLPTRTTIEGGAEVGTFRDETEELEGTKPNATQVTSLIATATGDVAARVGVDLNAAYHEPAETLAEYRTAMLIELRYFTEQVGEDESVYSKYKELYDEGLAALVEAVNEVPAPEPGEEGVVLRTGYPSYGFPSDGGGLIDWNTQS